MWPHHTIAFHYILLLTFTQKALHVFDLGFLNVTPRICNLVINAQPRLEHFTRDMLASPALPVLSAQSS
jgi:hypothetical protein